MIAIHISAQRMPRLPRRWITPKVVALLIVVATLAGLLRPNGLEQRAAAAEELATLSVAPARPGRPTTLHDRLVTGLKARLKSEVTFVDSVVAKVQAGQLPQSLVDQTYFWARSRGADPRNGRPRRPILYFKPAMTARAAKIGVVL